MSQPRRKRRKTDPVNSLLWKDGRMNSRSNVNSKDGNEGLILGCSYCTTDYSELFQHIHDIVDYQVDPDSSINMITYFVNHNNWKPFYETSLITTSFKYLRPNISFDRNSKGSTFSYSMR